MDRDYKIDAATRRCKTCERVFAVGEEYYSAVAETAEENRLERREFCPGCWKPDGAYYSFWKTRVPAPEQLAERGPRLVDMGRLMQLFEHLAESPDEQAQRFRYVLALVLMRKRRLKVVESRRLAGGRGEQLTLRETGGERTHSISCPSITDDEIRSVADRLRDILDMPEKWDQMQTDTEPAGATSSEPAAEAAGNPAEPSPPEPGEAQEPEEDDPDA